MSGRRCGCGIRVVVVGLGDGPGAVLRLWDAVQEAVPDAAPEQALAAPAAVRHEDGLARDVVVRVVDEEPQRLVDVLRWEREGQLCCMDSGHEPLCPVERAEERDAPPRPRRKSRPRHAARRRRTRQSSRRTAPSLRASCAGEHIGLGGEERREGGQTHLHSAPGCPRGSRGRARPGRARGAGCTGAGSSRVGTARRRPSRRSCQDPPPRTRCETGSRRPLCERAGGSAEGRRVGESGRHRASGRTADLLALGAVNLERNLAALVHLEDVREEVEVVTLRARSPSQRAAAVYTRQGEADARVPSRQRRR